MTSFPLGTRKRGFPVPLVYCNEYRLSGYFFNRAFSVTKLENNKNTRPLARAFINFLVFRRPDETLALVYEIFHHNRYIGILYFAANDCFMSEWLCEYSFVSLIADSSLAFLDIRISVLICFYPQMCQFFDKRGYPVSVFQVCHHQVKSQHYKRNKRKIPIAFYYSLSHFSLPTARFNPSFLKILGNLEMLKCTRAQCKTCPSSHNVEKMSST